MDANTLSRIKNYIDFIDVSVASFEKSVSMSNGSFASQFKNNKTIGVDKIENILRKYPEINPEWLLTGQGEMLKGQVVAPAVAVNESREQELLSIIKDKNKIIDGLEFKVLTLEKELHQDKSTTLVATTKSKQLVAATV